MHVVFRKFQYRSQWQHIFAHHNKSYYLIAEAHCIIFMDYLCTYAILHIILSLGIVAEYPIPFCWPLASTYPVRTISSPMCIYGYRYTLNTFQVRYLDYYGRLSSGSRNWIKIVCDISEAWHRYWCLKTKWKPIRVDENVNNWEFSTSWQREVKNKKQFPHFTNNKMLLQHWKSLSAFLHASFSAGLSRNRTHSNQSQFNFLGRYCENLCTYKKLQANHNLN